MMWTQSRVQRLQERAVQAQARICDLFIRRAVSVEHSQFAWGQFLNDDRDDTQYGIYGTSAAIQVLAMGGYGADHELVKGASKLLEDTFADRSAHNAFFSKGDLTVLYKVTSIAEAIRIAEVSFDNDCPVVADVLARALPIGAWGEYSCDNGEKDVYPRILPTASALLALRRYRPFRSSAACEAALRWVCGRIAQNGSLAPYQIALANLALLDYQSPGVTLEEYKQAVDRCKEQLITWAKKRRTLALGETQNYHFTTSQGGRRRNRYLFFLTDCLVALSLLHLNSPQLGRRYVLSTVQFFVTEILDKGGFAPESTRRFSSVDHLWLYKLLQKFQSASAESLRPQSWIVWSSASLRVRTALTASFLCTGLIGGCAALAASSMPFRVTGGLFGSMGLSLFGRALWEFFLKGKSE